MQLQQYVNKKIKVSFNDNEVLECTCEAYIPPLDNEEEIASIHVRTDIGGLVEIMENEIKSIEII